MREERTEKSIILRAQVYQERHQIVTAFCQGSGKVQLVAQNSVSSKRYGGALHVLTASELTFVVRPEREVWQLNEATQIHAFQDIRTSFERLSLASVFLDIVQRTAQPYEPSQELFILLSNALYALHENSGQYSKNEPTIQLEIYLYLVSFLSKILQWNGTQPQLLYCLECKLPLDSHSKSSMNFLISRAGWMCANCKGSEKDQSLPLDVLTIGQFFKVLDTPIRKLSISDALDKEALESLIFCLLKLLEFHVPGFDRTAIKPLQFILPDALNPQSQSQPVGEIRPL